MSSQIISIARGIGIILVVFGHVNAGVNIGPHVYLYHMPLFFLLGGLQFKPGRPALKVVRFVLLDMWLYAVLATVGYSAIAFLIRAVWGVEYQSFWDISLWHYSTEIWTGNGDNVQLVLTVWFLLAYGWASLLTFGIMEWLPARARGYVAAPVGAFLVVAGISFFAPAFHQHGLWWLNLLAQVSVGTGFMLLGVWLSNSPKLIAVLTSSRAQLPVLFAFLYLASWSAGAIPSIAWSDYAGMPSWLYLFTALSGCLTVLNLSKLLSAYAPPLLIEMGAASKTIMIHHLAVFAALNLILVTFGLMEASEVTVWSKGLLWLTWPVYLTAGLFVPLWLYRKQRVLIAAEYLASVQAKVVQ